MDSEIIKRSLSSIILIIVSFYTVIVGSYLFNCFIILILSLSLFEWHNMSFKKKYYYPGMIFLLLSFYSVYMLRNDEAKIFEFLIILIICILTDIGGFIFGKFFKGPKLTKISPNKTYSGLVGSFILPILIISLFITFYKDKFNLEVILSINFIIYICIISCISQCGDLIISYFKRLSNLKDTGKIIPGHGGVLDRIDGMIFVFPIVKFWSLI